MASKKDSNGRPQISTVTPEAAIPGGEFQIRGAGLAKSERPRVTIGDVEAPIVIGSDSCVIVRVPEGASAGELVVANGARAARPGPATSAFRSPRICIRSAIPAVDSFGNIYVTFSGSRGQKTPVSVYKIDLNYNSKPFVSEIMNATGPGFRQGRNALHFQPLRRHHLSSHFGRQRVGLRGRHGRRHRHRVRSGRKPVRRRPQRHHLQDQPLAPDLRFRHAGAFHRRVSSRVWRTTATCTSTGPTTSSFDSVHRISPAGEVETYYRGLGRPQGLAFDAEGRLYVAASLGGRRGVVRFDHDRKPELFLSGPGIVGLAFTPSRAMAGLHQQRAVSRGRWHRRPTSSLQCRTPKSSPSVRNC